MSASVGEGGAKLALWEDETCFFFWCLTFVNEKFSSNLLNSSCFKREGIPIGQNVQYSTVEAGARHSRRKKGLELHKPMGK